MNRIGIIGLGRMGRCLVTGLIGSKVLTKKNIFFTTRHPETTAQVVSDLGIQAVESNRRLAEQTKIVLLAVKPQNMPQVLDELRGAEGLRLVVSIVASWSTDAIEQALGREISVFRAMPNTPALVGAGITAVCPGRFASAPDWQVLESIFQSVGKMVPVDEVHLDAVTGLSGCGPAYVYVILESLIDAGVKVGLPRVLATQLAAQTILGAAKMVLETGKHPAALKDEVTTPAGCTIDGLLELEEGKLRVTLMKAVVQATERAKILGRQSRKS